ncbi:MAG TPA: hypothetical protein VKF40_05695 [Burkholderiales bacterium]|nr:hypothetical protein [Burkholderiales bacterium]
MKRKALLALGVTGALACGAASATTYLCYQNPSDVSLVSCAEIPSDALASSASAEFVPALEPAFVTYYLIEPATESLAAPDLGLQSEPMVVTYFYAIDSVPDSAGDE